MGLLLPLYQFQIMYGVKVQYKKFLKNHPLICNIELRWNFTHSLHFIVRSILPTHLKMVSDLTVDQFHKDHPGLPRENSCIQHLITLSRWELYINFEDKGLLGFCYSHSAPFLPRSSNALSPLIPTISITS